MEDKLLEDAMTEQITEEEMETPVLAQLKDFEKHPVWNWLRKQMLLDQRQAIIELTTGINLVTKEQLNIQDVAQRQGVYQEVDRVFSILEIAIEDNLKKEEK